MKLFAYQGQWNPGGVNPGAGQARRIDDIVRRVELVVVWNEEQKLQLKLMLALDSMAKLAEFLPV